MFKNLQRTLLRPLLAALVLCTLGSTLFLFAACSSQNTIVTPSPGNWKIVHSPNPGSAQNNLNAISATSATDAWAVGSFSNNHFNLGAKALIEHWNGTTWRVVASPPTPLGDSILSGVVAISPTNVWAVGNTFSDSNSDFEHPLIEHWNGSVWSIVVSPIVSKEADLTAVSALSANDIWAIGFVTNSGQTLSTNTLFLHWDGKAWKTIHHPNPGKGFDLLTGITAISPDDVWAIGLFSNENNSIEIGEELFEHWDGTSWSVIPGSHPGTQGNVLSAITAVSTNDVWAIGSTNNTSETDTVIEHWNGKAWSTIKGLNPGTGSNFLSAIGALSAHDIWAVGSYSSASASQQAQSLIEHWDGTSWSTVASPNIGTSTTTLTAAAQVPHSTNIWAVGTGATYGAPVSVSSPNATQTTEETPITAQTLIESCCS